MGPDYIIEEQENEYSEAMRRIQLREAAVHVANGMPRAVAIKQMDEISDLREEAERTGNVINDENGFLKCYLEEELNPPSEKGLNKSKIEAIHRELCESEGIAFA